MLARMKTAEAISSCSPPRRPVAPWPPTQGKPGERIQRSRGTQATRLIVMELGRFIASGPGDRTRRLRSILSYLETGRGARVAAPVQNWLNFGFPCPEFAGMG